MCQLAFSAHLARNLLAASFVPFCYFCAHGTLFACGVDAVWIRCGSQVRDFSAKAAAFASKMKILDVPQSGSVGGVTSSRNRNGQYRRTRANPVNPASSYQAAVRARMQLNSDAWKALTATQREGWAALGAQYVRYDSLGQAYDLTGFQAYCSVNNNRLQAGDAVLADAPLFAPPAPISTVTPTVTSASFSVAFTPTPLGAGERIFISCSPMRSAGRTFESDFRLITVGGAASTSPSNILAAYQARFGTPVTGSRIFVSVQRYLNGFLSQPIVTSNVVA